MSSTLTSFSIFCYLPIDITRLILQYLILEEIQLFDISLNQRESRSLFLSSLNGLELFDIKNEIRKSKDILWFLKRSIPIYELNIQFSNDNLIKLLDKNINNLKLINFNSTLNSLSDEIFLILGKCKNLKFISMENCLNVTDDNINKMLNENNNIISLDLTRCHSITSQSISNIAEKCPKLENLNLSDIHFISDNDISLIIEKCRFIRSIALPGSRITDRSINAILAAYPKIETFTIDSCRQVSSNGKLLVLRTISYNQLFSDKHDLQLLGARSIRRVLSDGKKLFY